MLNIYDTIQQFKLWLMNFYIIIINITNYIKKVSNCIIIFK